MAWVLRILLEIKSRKLTLFPDHIYLFHLLALTCWERQWTEIFTRQSLPPCSGIRILFCPRNSMESTSGPSSHFVSISNQTIRSYFLISRTSAVCFIWVILIHWYPGNVNSYKSFFKSNGRAISAKDIFEFKDHQFNIPGVVLFLSLQKLANEQEQCITVNYRRSDLLNSRNLKQASS